MHTDPFDNRTQAPRRQPAGFWPPLWVAAAALCAAGQAAAVGSMVDVDVVERDTGRTLQVYPHQGAQYVAGRPGSRYAIRITNRSGGRVLAVMAVDGVNIVSGQTATWNQSGYVLGPWQTHEITGWRKSPHEVAAFEFTSLPDSYAARTGRPNDVGVIGVAVFTERPAHVVPQPEVSSDYRRGRMEGAAGANADSAAKSARVDSAAGAERADKAAAPAAAPPLGQGMAESSAARAPADAEQKLGTGHGAREDSYAPQTTFVRSTRRPVEVVSIQYDRFENLARAGIIGGSRVGQPRPFPGSSALGYVPDPPRW